MAYFTALFHPYSTTLFYDNLFYDNLFYGGLFYGSPFYGSPFYGRVKNENFAIDKPFPIGYHFQQ